MTISLKDLLSPGGANIIDQREFKNWQDFYHGQFNGDGSSHFNTSIPQSQREVNGVLTNRMVTSVQTWTVPAGVTKIRLTCVGGGGGGGRYNSHYYGGDGGGGGGFASAEFTVTPGEILNVNVGAGGGGRFDAGYGQTGGSTTITDDTTSGSNISLTANGGQGGYYANSGSNNGGTASVSGNNMVSGTNISSQGGQGGYGSSQAFGFGPEGYGGGGGGSAGSMLGQGHMGGWSFQGGYSYGSAGGAGIGGHGGYADGSRGQWVGEHKSGSGGGSAGPGVGGSWGYTPSTYAYFDSYSTGGAGLAGSPFMGDYCDSHTRVSGLGGYPDYWETQAVHWLNAKGARYGDGESTGPGGNAANYYTFQANRKAATYVSGFNEEFIILKPKTFNGVLGRLWGGGGAGQICSNYHFGQYNRSGGDGGSGGGGGGAMGVTTSWNSGTRLATTYSDWDPANMAWRTRDSANETNAWRINGNGGHGGALGGGGASAAYGYAGNGGIGGGGGGAGGHYTGSYHGYGGSGGPGYVLIEW